MTVPDTPNEDIALLEALNGNAYDAVTNPNGLARGGHRQKWVPAMNAVAAIGNWIASVVTYLTGLAEQVAADAASAAAGSGTEATLANIRSGASAFYLSIRNVYSANAPVSLTDASSIAWDMALGINFKITLGGTGRTLVNPTNQVAGKSGLLVVSQDSNGNRAITGYGDDFIWIGDQPNWPTAPNAKIVISYFVEANGTILLNYGGSSS